MKSRTKPHTSHEGTSLCRAFRKRGKKRERDRGRGTTNEEGEREGGREGRREGGREEGRERKRRRDRDRDSDGRWVSPAETSISVYVQKGKKNNKNEIQIKIEEKEGATETKIQHSACQNRVMRKVFMSVVWKKAL